MVGYILIAFGGLVVVAMIKIYNDLITARNGYRNAFSQIDIQLKRRYDLVPNLIESVKGMMKFEQETFEKVVAARHLAMQAVQAAGRNPGGAREMRDLAQADAAVSSGVGRLLALAESYPDLKTSTNMNTLQEELASTENRIAFARQAFNDSVMSFNNKREIFPNSLLAGMFNFPSAELLQATESAHERQKVVVKF